jgi:hypothetical protein
MMVSAGELSIGGSGMQLPISNAETFQKFGHASRMAV